MSSVSNSREHQTSLPLVGRHVDPNDSAQRADESTAEWEIDVDVDISAHDTSLLARAAEVVALEARQTGRAQTVVDVLHGRALRHYARGLREYLTLRLRDDTEASAAWSQLRAMVAVCSSDSLVKAPGVRARLYRLAREVAGGRKAGSRIPVFRHAGHRFDRLRRELGALEAELLELRFARELRPNELALVFDWSLEEVMDRLSRASEKACDLLANARREGLRGLLLEAFRVDLPRESDDEPQAEPALALGSLVAGRYRVQARVGTGAFGDVYRAEDAEVPGHVVALKLLHQPAYTDEARQHALRELRHIASVFHPSVVQFKDHGWHERRLWFVMPWYDGETLAARVEREPLSRKEAHRIFVQLARALDAMHDAGIRHQDIKPDNVFLAELPGQGDVLPVLIDLGVSATEAEMLVAGTPTYFAPEVAAQFASTPFKPWVSSKADVFSLALTLRNALEPSTEEDVPAGAVESFIERRACEPPPPIEDRKLRFLRRDFDRWLSLEADQRPSASEFMSELDVLVEPEQRRGRRRRLIRSLLPLLLVASAAFGGAIVHYETQRQVAGLALSEARSDLAATSAQRAEIAERYDRMQLSSEELRARLASAEVESAQRDDELAASSLAATNARAELDSLSSELATALARAIELQGSLDQEREAAASQARTFETERASAQENEAALVRRLDAAAHAAQRSEERLAELGRRMSELETQVASAEAQVEAESARSGSLERNLQVQIAARRHAEDQVVALRARRVAPPNGADPSGAAPSANNTPNNTAASVPTPAEPNAQPIEN